MPDSIARYLIETFPNAFALLVGGFAGSTAKMVLAPELTWRVWMIDIVVGLTCALFLGAALGDWVADLIPALNKSAFLASGFLCGASGELIVRGIRRRVAQEIERRGNGSDNDA